MAGNTVSFSRMERLRSWPTMLFLVSSLVCLALSATAIFRLPPPPGPVDLVFEPKGWVKNNVAVDSVSTSGSELKLTAAVENEQGYIVREILNPSPGDFMFSVDVRWRSMPGQHEAGQDELRQGATKSALFAWTQGEAFSINSKPFTATHRWRTVTLPFSVGNDIDVLGLQIGGDGRFKDGQTMEVRQARVQPKTTVASMLLALAVLSGAAAFPSVRRLARRGARAVTGKYADRFKTAFAAALAVATLSLAHLYAPATPIYDSAENFSAAYNLAKYGVLTSSVADKPEALQSDFTREPLYPFLLAGALKTFGDVQGASLSCFLTPTDDTCAWGSHAVRYLNLVLLFGIGIGTYWAATRLSGSWLLGFAAAGAVCLSPVALGDTPIANTELTGALCLLFHSLFLHKTVTGPNRVVWAAASGACLALLILTKVVFLFWLLLVPFFFLSAAFLKQFAPARSLLISGAALFASCSGILATYDFGHYVRLATFNDPGRGSAISVIRNEYATMDNDELLAGMMAFTPYIGPPLTAKFYGEDVAAKFDRTHPHSYFQRSLKILHGETQASEASSTLDRLKLTPLFAYRGLFIGGCCHPAGNEVQPYPQPVSGRLTPTPLDLISVAFGVISLVLITALLAFCALLLIGQRFSLLFYFLPALYSYGIHSVATHYIPRYSQPLTPIATVALILLIVSAYRAAHANRSMLLGLGASLTQSDGAPSQALRFAVATVLSAFLTLSIPLALKELGGIDPRIGVGVTLVGVALLNFLIVRYFVFRSRAPFKREFLLFAGSSGVFRGLEYVGFIGLYTVLGVQYLIALMIVLVVSFCAKFLFHRTFIFGQGGPLSGNVQ